MHFTTFVMKKNCEISATWVDVVGARDEICDRDSDEQNAGPKK